MPIDGRPLRQSPLCLPRGAALGPPADPDVACAVPHMPLVLPPLRTPAAPALQSALPPVARCCLPCVSAPVSDPSNGLPMAVPSGAKRPVMHKLSDRLPRASYVYRINHSTAAGPTTVALAPQPPNGLPDTAPTPDHMPCLSRFSTRVCPHISPHIGLFDHIAGDIAGNATQPIGTTTLSWQ